MSLEEINKDAQERFAKLKTKMKLDGISNVSKFQEELTKQLQDKDIPKNSVLADKINEKIANATQKQMNFVDDSFSFIESLNLPPQLSLAIGYIISYGKTKNKSELALAINALGEEAIKE